jgi:hypothetical protein
MLEPYQMRVESELHELEERISRLHTFMGGYHWKKVGWDEQARMLRQLNAMHDYASALQDRVSNFNTPVWVTWKDPEKKS